MLARERRGRRRTARRAALLVLLAWTGCTTWPFGAWPDRTLFLRLPPDTPREQWVQRDPALNAHFDGVFVTRDEQEPTRDDPASHGYARLLRKAGIFLSLDGPDLAAAPAKGSPPDAPSARVRVEVRYAEDDHTSSNLARAALAPGVSGYRFGLSSTMWLRVWIPGEEPIVWQATTALERRYHHASGRDAARRLLYDEVDRRNLTAIVHALRAEPRLHRPPDELQPL